jgi:hypothetical protein
MPIREDKLTFFKTSHKRDGDSGRTKAMKQGTDMTGNGRENRRAGGPVRLLRPIVLLLLVLYAPFGHAADVRKAELRIPDATAKAGQELQLPIVVDQAVNLAAMKLVLHYNRELLTFKEGVRTQATQAMMHIINDKTPGKLVIVMAGARGIQGKDLPLMTLTFSVRKGWTGSQTVSVVSPELQLMGDDLKEIECRFRPATLTLVP